MYLYIYYCFMYNAGRLNKIILIYTKYFFSYNISNPKGLKNCFLIYLFLTLIRVYLVLVR